MYQSQHFASRPENDQHWVGGLIAGIGFILAGSYCYFHLIQQFVH